MIKVSSDTDQLLKQTDRIIGEIIGKNHEPAVVFFAGIHGNEPAGVYALQEVLNGLEPVQRRPGMYTQTERPNHLAQEVIDMVAMDGVIPARYMSKICKYHFHYHNYKSVLNRLKLKGIEEKTMRKTAITMKVYECK